MSFMEKFFAYIILIFANRIIVNSFRNSKNKIKIAIITSLLIVIDVFVIICINSI